MGMKKVNTTFYHPQTDGLVERFNRTLTSMLARRVAVIGMSNVLFAHRASLQESTKESPFFLLHGRVPRLPTEQALSVKPIRDVVEVDIYKSEVAGRLSSAWEMAWREVQKAQSRQKAKHDRRTQAPEFQVGDRVFVYMPAERLGKAHKFARPFRGPYRIIALFENGAQVNLVDRPQAASIRVALNRVRQ